MSKREMERENESWRKREGETEGKQSDYSAFLEALVRSFMSANTNP